MPRVTLGKGFAECIWGFAECHRHSAKSLSPVVYADSSDMSHSNKKIAPTIDTGPLRMDGHGHVLLDQIASYNF